MEVPHEVVEAWESAVVWKGTNLRTTMPKLIRRAGLKPQPSCETDPMQRHPSRVVTALIGNMPSVDTDHYLQTLDPNFQNAV